MRTPLMPGESIVREGLANLQRGIETVGGKLYLTTKRLIFEPHAFNIQRSVLVIPLEEVRELRPCWTRFLNLLPVTPNSLAVMTTDGGEYRFVVWRRYEWKEAIERQVAMR